MKRIFLLVFLMACFAAKSQVFSGPTLWGENKNRVLVKFLMGLPNDTLTPPVINGVDYKDSSFIAAKHNVVYLWNTTFHKWESFSQVTAMKSASPIYVYDDTLRLDVVPPDLGGTGIDSLGKPKSILRIKNDTSGTEWWVPDYLNRDSIINGLYVFHPPLMQNGVDVKIDFHAPIYNSDYVQDYHWKAGTPGHGMVWVFDSTAGGEWKYGYLTPEGVVLKGVDTIWVDVDTLRYRADGEEFAEPLPTFAEEFLGTVTLVGSGYGLSGGPITGTGTLTIDTTQIATVNYSLSLYDILNAVKLNKADSSIDGGYYPYSTNPKGYLTDESDPVADTRTITVNQGDGIIVDGLPTQTLGGTPSWTISLSPINSDLYADNLLVQPGYVSWSGTGLTFDVTAAVYDIGHIRYNSSAGQITLDAADATNPRIDAIAVDNTGSIVKITGNAEANPVAPQIDPSTQVLLTTILLPAGATEPPSVGNDYIYDENVEWTSSAVGLTANFDNTVNVYNGSKAALVSGFSNGQAIQWTNDSLIIAANQVLNMQVRLSSSWNNNNNGSVMLMRGSVPISQALLITNYGLIKNNSGGYQTISIPITAFNATDSFDRIRLTFIGNSGNDVYVDYVRFQSGLTSTVGSSPFSFHVYNGMTKVGADSAKLGGPVVEGTIFDMMSNYMAWRRKNNSNVNYTSAITNTGINWLAQYETDKQAEIVSMATGAYSGTFAQMETKWGSNITSVKLNGGTVNISAGSAGGDLLIDSTGQVQWVQYGNGVYTGTPSKYVAFTADGKMIEVDAPSSGVFTPTWGSIEGTLSNQTDLQTALDGKMDVLAGTATQLVAGNETLVSNKGVAGQTFSGTTFTTTLVSGETITTTISAGTTTPTLSKSWFIETPSATEKVALFYTHTAITISELADVVSGTSPSVTYNINYASAYNSGSPTTVFSSSRTTTSETGGTTTTFANASIPAGNFVWLTTSASSDPDAIFISIKYTNN